MYNFFLFLGFFVLRFPGLCVLLRFFVPLVYALYGPRAVWPHDQLIFLDPILVWRRGAELLVADSPPRAWMSEPRPLRVLSPWEAPLHELALLFLNPVGLHAVVLWDHVVSHEAVCSFRLCFHAERPSLLPQAKCLFLCP